MDVILLEKVENFGNLGDRVKVKAGFGRNYLIPSGKAVPASKDNIEVFEKRRAELEAKAREALAAAEQQREKVSGVVVTIGAKASEEGKLFGSVSNVEISEALKVQGFDILKRNIRMPEGPIRTIGEFEFAVHLYTDIDAKIKVIVVAEQ